MSFLISIARVKRSLADCHKFTPFTMRQFSEIDWISILAKINAKTLVNIKGTENTVKTMSFNIK